MPSRGVVHSLAENLPGRPAYPSSVIGLTAAEERMDAIATREIDAARKRLVETRQAAAGPDLREIYFRLLARRVAALKDRWGVAEARARSAVDPSIARPYEHAFRQAAIREAIERGVFARPGEPLALAIPNGTLLAERVAVALRNLRRVVESRRRDPRILATVEERHRQAFARAVLAQARAAEEATRIAEEHGGYPADILDAVRRSNRIAQRALTSVRAARTAEEASRVEPFAEFAAPPPPPAPEPAFETPEEPEEEDEEGVAKPPSLLSKGLAFAALTAPAWGSLLLFRRR